MIETKFGTGGQRPDDLLECLFDPFVVGVCVLMEVRSQSLPFPRGRTAGEHGPDRLGDLFVRIFDLSKFRHQFGTD